MGVVLSCGDDVNAEGGKQDSISESSTSVLRVFREVILLSSNLTLDIYLYISDSKVREMHTDL